MPTTAHYCSSILPHFSDPPTSLHDLREFTMLDLNILNYLACRNFKIDFFHHQCRPRLYIDFHRIRSPRFCHIINHGNNAQGRRKD